MQLLCLQELHSARLNNNLVSCCKRCVLVLWCLGLSVYAETGKDTTFEVMFISIASIYTVVCACVNSLYFAWLYTQSIIVGSKLIFLHGPALNWQMLNKPNFLIDNNTSVITLIYWLVYYRLLFCGVSATITNGNNEDKSAENDLWIDRNYLVNWTRGVFNQINWLWLLPNISNHFVVLHVLYDY